LVAKFYKIIESWKKRRALLNIRREFARAGFTLDHFPDSQIEGALTRWNNDITAVTLSAKTIYSALRQLAHVGYRQRKTPSGDEGNVSRGKRSASRCPTMEADG
jgi:hypothetical protein